MEQFPTVFSDPSLSVTKSELVIFIRPKAWVCVSPISAFMMLINREGTVTFDRSFVTFFRNVLHQGAVEIYADFHRQFFGRRFDEVLTRLKNARALLIPLFNADAQGENRNYWELAVLHKPSATLSVYDSIHDSFKFNDITPHLLRLANSTHSLYELLSHEWPEQWNQSLQKFSAQQGNGDDCGIFTNAYYVSHGIDRPPIVPGAHVSKIYRPQLALCLLENDTSSLL